MESQNQRTEDWVYIAGKDETDSNGVKVTGNEPWHSSKLLGPLLCSTKDILQRIHLGNIVFANFKRRLAARKANFSE